MDSKTHRVFLLLGSNQGDRAAYLASARQAIQQRIGEIVSESQVYVTEAWGISSQQAFLNQAVEVHTPLGPEEVLDISQEIEHISGRTRETHWGPRTLDIDIAFYDDSVIDSQDLVVPHPRIQQRNFALIPLIEIAGHMMHPVLQLTLHDLFEQSPDRSEVTILGSG